MIKIFGILLIGSLLLPRIAFAHSPIEGMDNFYNGVLHPALVPAHALLLIIFGFYVSQRGPTYVGSIGMFVLAVFPGLMVSWFNVFDNLEIALLVLSVIAGIATAANLTMPSYLLKMLASATGFLIGADSSQSVLVDAERLTFFLGCGLGVILLASFSWALGDYARNLSWAKISVRVVGSWITASALLVLVLTLFKTTT